MFDTMLALRRNYHSSVLANIIFMKRNECSMADRGSPLSLEISRHLVDEIREAVDLRLVRRGATTFEDLTRRFLRKSADLISRGQQLSHWIVYSGNKISRFFGYEHLAPLATDPALKKKLGDYIIAPDIIVARRP